MGSREFSLRQNQKRGSVTVSEGPGDLAFLRSEAVAVNHILVRELTDTPAFHTSLIMIHSKIMHHYK